MSFLVLERGGYFLILDKIAFLLGWIVIFLILFTFLIGFFGGWFLAKKTRFQLLKILKNDRVLILVPHPDDEVLGLGGLINFLSKEKIKKKIIFLTVGDSNPYIFFQKKKIKYNPEEFIQTGVIRAREAKNALRKLGVSCSEIIFLGYPDGQLGKMSKNSKKVFPSASRLTYVPYEFSPVFRQENTGENLLNYLKGVFQEFKPSKIFLPHRCESNSDHRAVFWFAFKVFKNIKLEAEVFQYLIHFRWKLWRIYPGKRKKEILFPPRFLAFQNNWYTFRLEGEDFRAKKKALLAYRSQRKIPTLKKLFNDFLAKNEIFEEFVPSVPQQSS